MIRVILGCATVALLGLLFWSHQIVEQEVKIVRGEIHALRSQLTHLEGLALAPRQSPDTQRPHVDPSLPNLLEEDPFYTEVLPKQLGPDFKPSGHLRTAERVRPYNLHPYNNWKPCQEARRRCLGTVADVKMGFHELFTPDLAFKVEKRGNAYWVHLRDNLYWAPLNPDHFPPEMRLSPHFLRRHRVTAHDFKFGFDTAMNPHVQEPVAVVTREELRHVEAFEVIDDLTFVVRWKEEGGRVRYASKNYTMSLAPLPCWVYQYFPDGSKIVEDDADPETYRTHSVFAQNFSQHWAMNVVPSCGPYLFDGFSSRQIAFKRNPHYHNPYAVLHESLTITYKENGEAIWQAFKAGELDYVTTESFPDRVGEITAFRASPLYRSQKAQGLGLEQLDYRLRAYFYIGWNQKNLLFRDPMVRKALTYAIDRKGCIQQVLSGLGDELTGPLMPGDPGYDPSLTPYDYDPGEAARLLKEAGWADLDGDGILEKEIDGEIKKFCFTIPYSSRSRVGRSYTDTIATALRDLGIECRPFGVEMHDMTLLFDGKEFDAILGGWTFPVAANPRPLWHSSGADRPGSSNLIAFAHEGVDQVLEELEYEHDKEEQISLYHAFHRTLHQEAPYTFLYVPKVSLLYREPVQNAFIPAERPDLIPGAIDTEPNVKLLYIRRNA
ncbi:MAG: ABC transporter substrate-binding protein [Parachlamydiales bacterium]